MQSDRSIEVAYVTKALAFAAAVMVALLFVLADAKPAHAVTLTVNSTADPGTGGCNSTECTLREAINVSNGLPTTDTINFNIPDGPAPGLEVKTISPASALQTITDRVTIDGYTQAGAVVNNATTNANNAVLKIELSGRRPNGSRLAASGLSIQASSCLVKGLSINRFGQHGVLIKSTSNTLEGNFIGIDPGGTLDRGNGRDGVRIESSDNLIGVRRTRRRTSSPATTITAC
jgi:CSLREA domain-containing protein